ncbi:MAG TPA: pyridoxamine 5'-phosphate oxidase family protein [Candidatus Limnocylindrales bacterium]|nr:pyridoxamine 5'-phosphate oxidase family protein [Candidatus Limnocylindrales bacterium]
MKLSAVEARQRAADADHGILATLHPRRGVDTVPTAFVIDGDLVAIPIDRVKPKASTDLQRTRNLDADPRASLLCEQWDAADWSRLWWVRLSLRRSHESTEIVAGLKAGLRRRYPQYESAPFVEILTFRIVEVSGWSAS